MEGRIGLAGLGCCSTCLKIEILLATRNRNGVPERGT